MWEKDININEVKEIRVKTTAYLGIGAIAKINDIAKELKQKKLDKMLILTGKSAYKKTGAWDVIQKALNDNGIKYTIFDKITPNPQVHDVDDAVAEGKKICANVVMGIGGGSPIDAAKSAAVLLKYSDKNASDLYEMKFTPNSAVPIIAVNLTHGTGTEVDRFAVVSIPEKEYKPAIAYDCLYPLYAIDDPKLMTTLPKNQTAYVTIDAVNHIVEACTTIVANPLSILLAQETVRLVANYLPKVLENPNDLEARYYLAYASLIAGTSFDNGLLHFTHALEHPLSAVKADLTHGLGLSILLPGVIKQIFDARKETLLDVLNPILGDISPETANADMVSSKVRQWLHSLGVTETLKDIGFTENDIDKLTDLAFNTPGLAGLLGVAPVNATKEVVAQIYRDSL